MSALYGRHATPCMRLPTRWTCLCRRRDRGSCQRSVVATKPVLKMIVVLLLATLLSPSSGLTTGSTGTGLLARASRIQHPAIMRINRGKDGKENENRHRSKMQEKRASSRAARSKGRTTPPKAQKAKAAKLELGAKRRLGVQSGRRQQRRGPVGRPREVASPARRYTRAAGDSAPINEALIHAVLQQREAARRRRDFASADRLWTMLRMMGVEVRDIEGVWSYVGPEQATRRRRDKFYLELFFRGLAIYTARNGR